MTRQFPADAKIQKILVCQLRQIGDVILTTPAVELLRRRFPLAEIHVFTEKKCLPVLENNPNVTRVWPLAEVEDAMEALRTGQVTRAVLDHTR